MSKELSIIITDDESHIRLLFKKVLTSNGFNIIAEASNGKEAIDLYREKKPDIMLMDVAMPYKTGVEALQEIKAEFPDAFIIMLTSLADLETVEKCIDLGAANYIRKDTPVFEIADIIRDSFQKR